MKSLADRMKGRKVSPEAWKKAFGGTKAVELAPTEGGRGAIAFEGMRAVAETDLALLISGKKNEAGAIWVPRSALHADSEIFALHDSGSLVVYEWFAKARGWV